MLHKLASCVVENSGGFFRGCGRSMLSLTLCSILSAVAASSSSSAGPTRASTVFNFGSISWVVALFISFPFSMMIDNKCSNYRKLNIFYSFAHNHHSNGEYAIFRHFRKRIASPFNIRTRSFAAFSVTRASCIDCFEVAFLQVNIHELFVVTWNTFCKDCLPSGFTP